MFKAFTVKISKGFLFFIGCLHQILLLWQQPIAKMTGFFLLFFTFATISQVTFSEMSSNLVVL